MIFEFLAEQAIEYLRVDHPAVFTCEEAAKLVPPLPGAETKNLFLRDGKGKQHFLVTVPAEKSVNLKQLGELLEVKGLGFASAERLQRLLGVEPGAVTLLAAFNDRAGEVGVVIDAELWKSEALKCHPLVNTSTLSLSKDSVERFLNAVDHPPRVVTIPGD